ncbi:flagellin [Methanosarcina sp. 1.H.T.1A.1]|uniref:archaellin/type IV pilin N-terminal domain-containing protein n=1 Tax=Methanosarcina sp. 1.H.T.1A.1 TaxID=1483602 RepID=UPI0006213FEB|nr:archaellin/type IV pilin N-terminal domain-containing protein [Methanosarcina sp. 1.H.T.1A.1]KKH99743.1 flagellin [Methanosarcina sp. 1.H.T.1A.1]
MWNRLIKDEKGFTGLEAAIVLVAFVVVAAVFSYVMLGAGFYTTQKSQEVVHTGVAQASSSLAPSGDVIVKGGASSKIGEITFYITNTAGGTAVDLNKTIITYTDIDDYNTQAYNDTANAWDYSVVIDSGSNALNLVEKGEKYRVTLDLSDTPTNDLVTTGPGVNEKIKIEVKPPEGAVLILERTMPASITNGQYYTVY